jgi:GNAT superfamily N-acetyltransferase
MEIRPYRPQDRSHCYDVCVKTGLGGQDATGVYSDDDLIPEIFCGPYLDLEPELAFVVDDGERAVGYVLGAADTRAFVERYRQEVLPGFAKRFGDLAAVSADEREMTELGLQPERMLIPELGDYPAHLHIDLLPVAQGQGLGRRLIETLLDALAARGVKGVHLEMDAANHGAGAFYSRLGFRLLESDDPGSVRFGMRLPRAQVSAV